ncbi:MAG: ABC transporter permease [bacterium]
MRIQKSSMTGTSGAGGRSDRFSCSKTGEPSGGSGPASSCGTTPARHGSSGQSLAARTGAGLALNLRAAWARAYVRIVGANREPSWLIFDTGLPLLSLAAYVYVYRAMEAPPEFVGFVILGGAMTAYWMNVLWSMASQFYWEKMMGQLQLFMIAPMSRMAILGGMAAGGLLATTIRAGAALLLGCLLFQVRFSISSTWSLLAMFVLTMAALYGMGMMFASLFMVWGREAWHAANLLQEPVYLLSGFYFPVRGLGYWTCLVASFLPLTLGLDGMRQLLFGEEKALGLLPVGREILFLIVLSILFLVGAAKALQKMERLGKKEGRLTSRWQ